MQREKPRPGRGDDPLLVKFNPQWQDEEEVIVKEKKDRQKSIVLINDDFNSFDHVIECLVKYCKHSVHQGHQCALIVHNNGRCDVKRGTYDKLLPICEALLENGLTAEIEEI